MEYKRKVSSQRTEQDEIDHEFGKLKMLSKSKPLMPIIFALVMLVFIIAIFFSGIVKIPENTFATVSGIAFLIIGILQISMVRDCIKCYEYGIVEYSFFNLRKKRLAYDEIDAIIETKHRMKRAHNNIALWKLVGKAGKKSMTIDPSSYHNITEYLQTIRRETKIKNIAD